MSDKKLYVKIHRNEIMSENVCFQHLGYFYDMKSKVGIRKMRIEPYDLKVGCIYDFTYEDDNDSDTYEYLILKKEESHVYYLAEYYCGKFYQFNEGLLGKCWVKCDIKEELGIDVNEWKSAKINNSSYINSIVEELRVKVDDGYLVATSYNGNINIVLEDEDGTIFDTITAKRKELDGSQIIDILTYDVVNGNTFARSICK